MARIPEFRRQQLVSSVVGTPGVDTSGVTIAEAIGGIGGTAQQISGEIAQKRRIAFETTQANDRILDFDIALRKMENVFQDEVRDDPINKLDIFRERADETLESVLSSIESPRVRQTVSNTGTNIIRGRIATQSAWLSQQEGRVAGQTIANSANKLAFQAHDIGRSGNSIFDVLELVDQAAGNIEAAKTVLSPEQVDRFSKDTPKQIVEGFLKGKIKSNPEEMIEEISGELIREFMTVNEVEKFKALALDQVDANENQAQEQLQEVQDKNRFRFFNRIIQKQNTPTLEEIAAAVENGNLDPDDGESLQNSLLSADRDADDFFVRQELNTKLIQGELQTKDIIQNAAHLTKQTQVKYLDYLTSNIQNNPAVQRAFDLFDAQIQEDAFGVRALEDQKLLEQMETELIDRTIQGNEAVFVVAEEIVNRHQQEQKAKKLFNIKRAEIRKAIRGKNKEEKIQQRRRNLAQQIRQGKISPQEAQLEAEVLEDMLEEIK